MKPRRKAARRPVKRDTGRAQAAPAQALPAAADDIYTSTYLPPPNERPLKVYAYDPSAGHFVGNHMTAQVRFEPLKPGPVGERFAVIDYDGSNRVYYQPVDLEDSRLVMRGGIDPSESDPRFHQQMVYAVASETLQRFEHALGRKVRWRGRQPVAQGKNPVPRGAARTLNLFPHAMCQANAFYSPEAHGVLFGYFRASKTEPGPNLPGQTVFTCLSHDIIAHETTHAIIDGIRSYFTEPTNVDVPAFHEAFADLAALFVHFTHKDALLDTLKRTGGRLFQAQLKPEAQGGEGKAVIQAQIAAANPLIQLALQFGYASGMRSGLRSALGVPPDSNDINVRTEPHDRGSILVAAVFDAYLTIYTRRTADLFRIYRAGGGPENPVDLPEPLAERLGSEASETAEQFFSICARALDYCPPIDITFGDFLRALLTAHVDFCPIDSDGVRDALMQAFRLRGIVAEGAKFFSEDALCWPKVERGKLPPVTGLLFGDPNGLTKDEQDTNGAVLRKYAKANACKLGFDSDEGIEAPSFHPMFHPGPDGRLFVDMVVELVQERRAAFGSDTEAGDFPMRSGATLLIAQDSPVDGKRPDPRVRFVIGKHYSADREERVRTYLMSSGRAQRKGGDERFQIDFGLVHSGV